MIRLITGLPGHGKTLWTVAQLLQERAKDDSRPLCVDGIRGLTVDHISIDGRDWEKAPDGSIIVIDEAQRIFPTRGASTPPPHVAALATHRHRGIDLWLITQHPGNIDSFIRERLIEDHVHVFRVAGSESAMVYRWSEVQTDPRSMGAREAAITSAWMYPKEAYAAYSSAVMHTAKPRIPWSKLAMIAGGLLAPILFVFGLSLLPGVRADEPVDVGALSIPARSPQESAPAAQLTAEQWLARYTPRVPYRPESAPAYDRFMAASEPPRIACIDVQLKGCKCYTEQATPWEGIPRATCQRLAREGLYQPIATSQQNTRGAF